MEEDIEDVVHGRTNMKRERGSIWIGVCTESLQFKNVLTESEIPNRGYSSRSPKRDTLILTSVAK